MAGCRVLLLYPNERDVSLVPPVFGLFAALLRERGHETALFDCTGYDMEGKVDPDIAREKALFMKPTGPNTDKKVKKKLTNMYDDFTEKVQTFSPDLIAVSVTESTFLRGISLLNHLRLVKKHNILTIMGGVFPTFAPDRTIREPSIDIVCVGEGDVALVELCDNLERSKDFSQISNLWIKKSDGTTVKNPMGAAVDINSLPVIDFSVFEDDRFYRPMRGKTYRMLPIETHRGCPYTCTFCNSPTQNVIYDTQTQSNFFRKASIEKIRNEIINFKKQWNGEYVFFWADTFLAWSSKELAEFCEMYSEFKFPFWCQSRSETVSDTVGGYEKLKMLKDVGLHHMSFGMEHGNEKFRREVVGRDYTNEDAIAALKNPAKLDIPFTINNIIGFPDETRELAMDTVEVNRHINSFNLSCSTFAPFKGTDLRALAEKRGYVDSELISPPNANVTTLNMPMFTKEQIYGLQRTFVMYVKFPKNRWPEIEKAEPLTPEGDAVWESLRKEFLDTYLQEPEPIISKVNDG
jgi:anaerobic magnesium-protoporphyrin IX monomethyl ester cyclase